MKTKYYRTMFRILSFLTDKTNGSPCFAMYKLALGAAIIGLSTASCAMDKEPEPGVVYCYVPVR